MNDHASSAQPEECDPDQDHGRRLDRERPQDARGVLGPVGLVGQMGRAASDLSTGRVISVGDKGVQVLTEAGRHIIARRAASCLLDPEPGDVVLAYLGGQSVRSGQAGQDGRGGPGWQGGQRAYVLSVLEKAEPSSTLSFPGDVSLKSPGRASLSGRELDMSAVSGSLSFVDLSVASSSLRMRLNKAVCLARSVETTVGSLVQRLTRSFRQVAETETLRAGAVRQFITDRFFQRSGNATILADGKVKVDADKIELG